MLDRLFLEHPRTVGETYPQHMLASLTVASRLFAASIKCVVHAIVPAWCKTSGSDAIVKLHTEIAPRRYDQPTF
jgi:hypothetical protein